MNELSIRNEHISPITKRIASVCQNQLASAIRRSTSAKIPLNMIGRCVSDNSYNGSCLEPIRFTYPFSLKESNARYTVRTVLEIFFAISLREVAGFRVNSDNSRFCSVQSDIHSDARNVTLNPRSIQYEFKLLPYGVRLLRRSRRTNGEEMS